MIIGKMNEAKFAVIIAIGTAFGGISSSLLDSRISFMNTNKETESKMIEIAISILKKEPKDGSFSDADKSLREWAVKTINSVSKIDFDEEDASALINGETTICCGGW